ncbi:MAG: hypothetical protein GKS06_17195 [Acidobacteria bacterium]|nr:hypothetical protein [Acidobacteriota bacterium]
MLNTLPGRRVGILIALVVTMAPAGLASAQESDEAIASFVASVARQDGDTQILELSLNETVELVLRHNLQVRIAALNPDLAAENIRSARAQFDPTFTFNIPQSLNRSTQPQSSVLGGADVLTNETIAGGFQFNSNTTWGLGWSVGATVQRQVSNSQFSTFNPQWNTSLTIGVRQALLRNRGDANQRQLLVAQNDHLVSTEQFRAQLQNTIFQVIQAYWTLVQQTRALQIQRESLALAVQQHRDNTTRVRVGTLQEVATLQTEQQVANAELNVLQAELALDNQQDLMRSLLNLDAVVDLGWSVEIVPTDEPAADAPQINIEREVAEALENNPTIRQNRLNLTSRQIDLNASKNGLLPQLDFIANGTLSGLGGDQIFRAGNVFGNSGVAEIQTGGVQDAFQQLFSGDFRNWSVGLQLIVPVRNDFAEAQHAQATIRERQAQTQVESDMVQVRLGVQNAARSVTGGAEQVATAGNAVLLAERQYNAEVRRFEEGVSSTFQVLNFQGQLTFARQRELNALINLNLALANLALSKGTLLDSYGVDVDDAGVGGPRMRATNAAPAQAAVPADSASGPGQ